MKYYVPMLFLNMEKGNKSSHMQKWIEWDNARDLFESIENLKKIGKGENFTHSLAIIEADSAEAALKKLRNRDCVILSVNKTPVLMALFNSRKIKEFPRCNEMLLLPSDNRIFCNLNHCDCCLMPDILPHGNCVSKPYEKDKQIGKWFECVEEQRVVVIIQ
jgi:hypothetical protein